MNRTQYRDLPELGLTLVTPNDPNFEALVRDIQSRQHPFDTMQFGDMDSAAVLMNGSGKTIVVFCYLWRYTTAEGATRTSSTSNLGSSTQWDVLTGGSEDVQDLGTFILPGSKRLITEEGMFGNSLDVLPPSHPSHGRFSMGAGGGGRRFRRRQREDSIAATELSLDLAIFQDGLCVGPDESGLVESLTEALDLQRRVAQEAVTALRSGASEGRVFDIIRPFARHTPPLGPGTHRRPAGLMQMFTSMAIHHLVNAGASELLAWFEAAAQPPSLQLRKPS